MLDLALKEFNGEPRMRDIDIAEALGFERARNIRKLVSRYIDSLEAFGEVFRSTVERNSGVGRPEDCFWLNEQQTVFICLKSESPKAVELTVQVVKVFVDWRHGSLAPPVDQWRFTNDLHPDADTWLGIVREARILFGRDAAAAMWAQSPLPPLPVSNDSGFIDDEPTDLQSFLQECCVVTGASRDFISSRDLLDAFRNWAFNLGAPPTGERAASLALRRLAGRYRDPETGCTFGPGKQRVTGYRGIRLRAADA